MTEVPESVLMAAAGMLQPFAQHVTAESLKAFMTTSDGGKLISISEAAERLAVSRVTIYSMINDGRLKALALNPGASRKHYRISLSALDAIGG